MNSTCSNSTISTTASMSCSISSKNMLLNMGSRNTAFKASRNAKYTLMGTQNSSRWRAPARRDSSLNNLIVKPKSSLSHLARGLETMRVESTHKLINAEFTDAPCSEIYFKKEQGVPTVSIKSAALNRALHRDIDLFMLDDDKTGEHAKERWSSTTSGERKGTALHKPKRQKSSSALKQPTRKVSDNELC